ncbi:MAG: hypothetical protein SOZ02_10370 [Hallerella porci]|uniref:hypothetical protein n=1 Tax=Hallerella TaxID=2815788 RepID=UPI000D04AB00|nr:MULTISPECIES: hypothetical protein [Hallerella]MCI5600148.1 hypothetical protein [Hallerella sp.]MDY3922547.1 hypothetical protein [Hallerella porci]
MGNIFQTSGFQIDASEASKLLHVFPLILDVGEKPALLFRLDEDLKVGALVSFRLVAGFRILNWKGYVTSVQGNSWTAEQKQGPFLQFRVEHSEQNENSLWEASDELSFSGEAELVAALEKARIIYAFQERAALLRAKDSYESRHATESFRAFQSGFSAG